uniref:F-box domain-containing protein n=1 Tax=Angiostrongylus cantonensis TaxID=6313 RepID=A0A0K0DAX3_ANGCA
MLNSKIRKLFAKFNVDKDMKIRSVSKKKHQKRNHGTYEFPDNIIFCHGFFFHLIFDYSSPFDVVKWSRVCKQLKGITDNRVQHMLYLDVLRFDITQILPRGTLGDGDFFRHPTCNLLAHHEHRSILLAAHTQWTTKEVKKLRSAIQYFGRSAHTITLDACIAELCVAGQCTTDISTWFAFQAAAGGTDPVPMMDGIQSTYLCQTDTDLPPWNPTTQRIPLGPLFPKAKEITFRCTIPQLRRMRRLAVYRTPATLIFSPEQLQVFRLSIIGARNRAPATLKLRPFREWLDADHLGNKLCIQFS